MAFAGATGWLYRAVAIACNLATLGLLFRYLPSNLLGLWFLMLGVQSMTGLFDLGFGQTLQRRIAFAKATCGPGPDVLLSPETKTQIRGLLRLALRVFTIAFIVVFVVVYICGRTYFGHLNLSQELQSDLRIAWILMSLGYAVNTWGGITEATLNGLGDIGWSNVVNIAAQVFTLAATWAVLISGLGVNGLAVVWLLKGIGIRHAGWRIVKSRHRWISSAEKCERHVSVAAMIRPALAWWLAVGGYFLSTGASQYLIALYMGPSSLPDYSATYAALAAVQGALVGVVSAGTPLFSQMLKAGQTAAVRETITLWTKYALGCVTLMFSVICVWGKEVFETWLGSGHFVGWTTLWLLLALMTLEAHQGMMQVVCVAAERLEFFKAILLGGCVSVTLALLLIPRVGIPGAALASLTGEAATQLWIVPRQSLAVLDAGFKRHVRTVFVPVAGATAGVLAVGAIARILGVGTSAGLTLTVVSAVLSALVFLRHPLRELRGMVLGLGTR